MQKAPSLSAFLGMHYWPTWMGIALLSILAYLPHTIRMHAGALLGRLIWLLGRERRYITSVNVGICFPELDSAGQRRLVRDIFVENGIGLIETVTGWVRKPGSFRKQTTLIGLPELESAQARGRGILLIGAHFSTLDFGANLLSHFHPFAVTYRAHRNPLFDAFMLRGRLSNCNGVFSRNDIRGAFRHLKAGLTLWYAPDQDYGPEHAVYSPFFGKPAATITAASRIAAFNQSSVFLLRQHRVGRTRQYEIEITPFPDNFPSGDDEQDAATINDMLERAIRRYPAQYLWMHKRFKTQPGGKPESPYINIKTPNRRLTEAQFSQVIAGATLLQESGTCTEYRLPSGLQLLTFPGTAGKRFSPGHPANVFDRNAKKLRMAGINAVTVDNIFRVPKLKLTVLTVFQPEGRPLATIPSGEIDLPGLAAFIARMHSQGFLFNQLSLDNVLLGPGGYCILDPRLVHKSAGAVSMEKRCRSLTGLLHAMRPDKTDREDFADAYCRAAGIIDPDQSRRITRQVTGA